MTPNPDLLELITYENIVDLNPGDWIWDSHLVVRHAHERTLEYKTIQEPAGFRQIHIIDLKPYPGFSSKPFMLSTVDRINHHDSSYVWVYFEENRFYKFKESIYA